ncbi:hypothetical protein Tco_1373151 [Tanacetum coccineum]
MEVFCYFPTIPYLGSFTLCSLCPNGLGAFVNHYNQFLRAKGVTIPLDDHDLFTRVLDDAKADFIVRDVSNDEVKGVIFSMGDDRAPGPDGFTDAFFKKARDVVGGDITCVI